MLSFVNLETFLRAGLGHGVDIAGFALFETGGLLLWVESEEKKNNNLENQAKDYGKSALVEWIKMQIISKGGTSIEIFQMEKAKICCCVFGSKYIFFLISSNGVAEDEILRAKCEEYQTAFEEKEKERKRKSGESKILP